MRKLQILLPMLLLALFSLAQQRIITGRILSKKTNEPLQGVSVQTKTVCDNGFNWKIFNLRLSG